MERDSSANQVSCQWCAKQIDSNAIRCPGCGKLRKDIYTDKIRCYIFCIAGGFLIGISIALWKSDQRYDYDYNYTYSDPSANTINYVLLAIGIISAFTGIIYYVRTSHKLKNYWWI